MFALKYTICAFSGYMAVGNAVTGDVLVGFPGAPSWLLIVANMMVLLHMVAAVQVISTFDIAVLRE